MPDTPVPESTPFDRLGMKTGDVLHLESIDTKTRFTVKLIGYVPGGSILVLPPVIKGKQVLLRKDKIYNVRAAVGGKVCAFRTQVLFTHMQPYAYSHLQYPEEMQALQVRESERVDVRIEASVTSEFDTGTGEWPRDALMVDLSKSGCGLRTRLPIGVPGHEVVVHFIVTVAGVSKQLHLKSVIRNRIPLDEEGPHRFFYGLQFAQLSEAARLVLNGFIFEKLRERDGG
ncbi:flagellar brake protein [Hahella sp. SMD15-11]|uniref:Flagellar brake protein n=1 Tax=Thermohahella caldifontis TaxID=3142973 RepID=A0AB39UZG8_9GAMM